MGNYFQVCYEMSSDSSSLSLDEVNTWNVDALRLFCRKRHLKVSGNKAELVARVFATSEMGLSKTIGCVKATA